MEILDVENCLQKTTNIIFDTSPNLITMIFSNKYDAFLAEEAIRDFLSSYRVLKLYVRHNGHLDISFVFLEIGDIGNIRNISFEKHQFMSFTNLLSEHDKIYLTCGYYEKNGVHTIAEELVNQSGRNWYDCMIRIFGCETQFLPD